MALIDKASLLMVPSTYEAGKLYNVLPSGNRAPDSTDQNSGYDQTRADFDFDRGSNASATRIGSDGLIKKYRENLLLQSNSFDQTEWPLENATITGGQIGYDSSSDAWLLDSSIAGGNIRQGSSVSGVNTFSIYAKAGTANGIRVRFDQTTDTNVYVNLTDGSLSTSGNTIDIDIQSIGDGWYRVTFAMLNAGMVLFRIYPTDGDVNSTTGSIYIQSAQLEKGLVATDYLDSTSVTGKAGVLVDLPRINYDANGQNGSLLLEPSRANAVTQSEYFNAWSKISGATVEDNFTTSPEGVKNAAKITYDGTTNGRIELSVTASGTSTQSVYLKVPSGTQTAKIGMGSGDLSTITITDEWQRFTHTGTGNFPRILCDDSAVVYAYGAQVESGASYASSYIPTMGTSETRAADVCLGAGEASTFNSNNGVLFWEGSILSNTTIPGAIALIGAGTNRVQLYNSGTSLVVLIQVDGVSVFGASTSGTIDITSNHKYAVKWGLNDFAFWIDGVEYSTDTSGATFSNNTLTEFSFSDLYTNYLYANTKQAAVFNEALNDSELATLTTL